MKNKTPQKLITSLVSIYTRTDGRAHVLITGDNGNLTLEVRASGPTIAICGRDGDPMKYQAVCGIEANGHFKGWFVAKHGQNGERDTLAFFPVRKKRAPAKQRTPIRKAA